MSTQFKTINRTWFKNQMRKGNLIVKCTGKYSDDYAFDAAYNFQKDEHFDVADKNYFDDWYLTKVRIYGDKQGEISVCFASCEYYTFKAINN